MRKTSYPVASPRRSRAAGPPPGWLGSAWLGNSCIYGWRGEQGVSPTSSYRRYGSLGVPPLAMPWLPRHVWPGGRRVTSRRGADCADAAPRRDAHHSERLTARPITARRGPRAGQSARRATCRRAAPSTCRTAVGPPHAAAGLRIMSARVVRAREWYTAMQRPPKCPQNVFDKAFKISKNYSKVKI